MRSRKTSRYKNQYPSTMSFNHSEYLQLFWNEKAAEFLLPYLDKSDLHKLSQGMII
jgi:hypothetical protein